MVVPAQIHLPPVSLQGFFSVGALFPICAPLSAAVAVVGLASPLTVELGAGSGILIEENILLLRLGGLDPHLGAGDKLVAASISPGGSAIQAHIPGIHRRKLSNLPVCVILPCAGGNYFPVTLLFPTGGAHLHTVVDDTAVFVAWTSALAGQVAQPLDLGHFSQIKLNITALLIVGEIRIPCTFIPVGVPVCVAAPVHSIAGRVPTLFTGRRSGRLIPGVIPSAVSSISGSLGPAGKCRGGDGQTGHQRRRQQKRSEFLHLLFLLLSFLRPSPLTC